MKEINYPFIFIAALRRTGSTLVSEALSQLPYCHIFQEPYLSMGYFFYSDYEFNLFLKNGVNLSELKTQVTSRSSKSFVENFRKICVPNLNRVVKQLGVKEIRLRNWELYANSFPNMKVLLTGRDPRDLYISLHSRYSKNLADWKGKFDPWSVSADLLREFHRQMEIFDKCDSMLVKYENLCKDRDLLVKIKKFTQSHIPTVGDVGKSLSHHPSRIGEHIVHGRLITDRSVGRWKNEEDARLREEAVQTFELMGEYTRFWKYKNE